VHQQVNKTWQKKGSVAPLVHQEDDDGNPNLSNTCVGFFWKYEGTNAIIPSLDYLINQGWEIVQK
jgi:hypothetical protein